MTALVVNFTGTGGQSFAAFLAKGITFNLTGEANDYHRQRFVGRAHHCAPQRRVQGASNDNIIVGNTVLYGATSGEAYFAGVAGERFAVRPLGQRRWLKVQATTVANT